MLLGNKDMQLWRSLLWISWTSGHPMLPQFDRWMQVAEPVCHVRSWAGQGHSSSMQMLLEQLQPSKCADKSLHICLSFAV